MPLSSPQSGPAIPGQPLQVPATGKKATQTFIGPPVPPGYVHPNTTTERLASLQASVDFWKSSNKERREAMAAEFFLDGLRARVDKARLRPGGDPPDVIYGSLRMEVKELLNPGRKRDAEYKKELADYKRYGDQGLQLTGMWIGDRPMVRTEGIFMHYGLPKVQEWSDDYSKRGIPKKDIDLLFYYNFDDPHEAPVSPGAIDPGLLPDLAAFGFRSISMTTNNHAAFVFYAAADAPVIIASAFGHPQTPYDFASGEDEQPRRQTGLTWHFFVPTWLRRMWPRLPAFRQRRIAWVAQRAALAVSKLPPYVLRSAFLALCWKWRTTLPLVWR